MTRRGALTLMAGLCTAALVALVPGCSTAPDPWEGQGGEVRVVVTIPPLYSLVKAVGGDRVAVKCLCTTTGPHHFQADARDVTMFRKADIFFAVGLSLDDTFADQLHAMSRRSRELRYIKLGGRLAPAQLLATKGEHVHADGTKHSHGKYDPHVWLGLPEIIALTDVVRDELTAVNPPNLEEYKKRAEEVKGALRRLHEEGQAKLAKKSNKRIVSSHEALGYFARSFGLEIVGTVQPWPGEAPTGKHLEELVKLCGDKDRPVAAITVEPQYRGSGAPGTLQQSIKGVKVPLVPIDTLETAEAEELAKLGAGWYEEKMKKNIQALAEALP